MITRHADQVNVYQLALEVLDANPMADLEVAGPDPDGMLVIRSNAIDEPTLAALVAAHVADPDISAPVVEAPPQASDEDIAFAIGLARNLGAKEEALAAHVAAQDPQAFNVDVLDAVQATTTPA